MRCVRGPWIPPVAGTTGGLDGRPRQPAPAARGATTDRLFAVLFAAGLAWAPFWLGGAWRFPWGVNALVFPGLAFAYEIALWVGRRERPMSAREIAAPMALFLAVVIWIAAQMAPLGLAAPIAALGARTPASFSVDTGATAIALIRLLTDASVFWLAAQLGRDPALSRRLLQAFAAIVALYSAYGLFLAEAYDNAIPGFAPPDGGFEVRSTFVNRNSFAAYAGLGLVTILALIASRSGASAAGPPLARWLETAGARAVLVAAGLVVLAALLATASRGGILSAAVGVATLAGLAAERGRRRSESRAGFLVGLVGLAAAFAAYGGPMVERLAGAGFSDAQRIAVYRSVLVAALDRPLSGFGYGSFVEVFPLYRGAGLMPVGVWEMAHDAYLEAALGLGFVFAALLTIALGWLAARCFAGALLRNRNPEAPLAGASAATLIAANALVDYSVQIEAVTIAFMTLLGLGVAQARRPAARTAEPC